MQEAFGPSTFFVTEMLLGGQAELTNGALRMPGGILVRGNLRSSREEAFDTAEAAIKRMFGMSLVAAHGDTYQCSTPIGPTATHTHACDNTTARRRVLAMMRSPTVHHVRVPALLCAADLCLTSVQTFG